VVHPSVSYLHPIHEEPRSIIGTEKQILLERGEVRRAREERERGER
jgi:hypothetical protein